MESENKWVYKNAKEAMSLSNYLPKVKHREQRRLLSKLRLGVLPLEVEKGRRSNLSRSDRTCKLCHTEQVEDEIHFLFMCPSLELYRQPYLSSISELHPHFANQSHQQQINYLYFNEKVPNNILEVSSNLLFKLNSMRDTLNSS